MTMTTFWEAHVWLTQDFVIIHFITGTFLDLIKNSRQEKKEIPSVTVVCLADQYSERRFLISNWRIVDDYKHYITKSVSWIIQTLSVFHRWLHNLMKQHSSKSNTTSEYQNMKRKGQNTHHSFIHNS